MSHFTFACLYLWPYVDLWLLELSFDWPHMIRLQLLCVHWLHLVTSWIWTCICTHRRVPVLACQILTVPNYLRLWPYPFSSSLWHWLQMTWLCHFLVNRLWHCWSPQKQAFDRLTVLVIIYRLGRCTGPVIRHRFGRLTVLAFTLRYLSKLLVSRL